ncbi:MAG: ArsR/SmtB family transcription factor, partial [Nitrososphaerales archaeon]
VYSSIPQDSSWHYLEQFYLRLEIIDLLKSGEKTVSELIQIVGIKQATLSQHLAILREREIITSRKEGMNTYYRLRKTEIVDACSIIRGILKDLMIERHKMAKRL